MQNNRSDITSGTYAPSTSTRNTYLLISYTNEETNGLKRKRKKVRKSTFKANRTYLILLQSVKDLDQSCFLRFGKARAYALHCYLSWQSNGLKALALVIVVHLLFFEAAKTPEVLLLPVLLQHPAFVYLIGRTDLTAHFEIILI